MSISSITSKTKEQPVGDVVPNQDTADELLNKLPYLEECNKSLEMLNGLIICPACGEGIRRIVTTFNYHWTLKHPELLEAILERCADVGLVWPGRAQNGD